MDKVRSNSDPNYGLNALTEEYVNLVEAGIVDPAKVSRTALENAASIASLLLTTECLIADLPEKGAPQHLPAAIQAEICIKREAAAQPLFLYFFFRNCLRDSFFFRLRALITILLTGL